MGDIAITGLPDDATILQGYFVWTGLDSNGRRLNGGIEYPYAEDRENSDYDSLKTIGMLTFARGRLLAAEMEGYEED